MGIFGVDRRPRWHPIWNGNPIIARPDEIAKGEPVHIVTNGPNCRPYIVPPFTKETGWTFNAAFRCRDHVAKIYLTNQERDLAAQVRETVGPYVLIEPYTKHENFRWSLPRWAALIDACPGLTFVQHTHDESLLVLPGAYPVRATFREACALASLCDVYVRSESGMCHAAATFGVPQVTIFGGCMDPTVMGGYPGQFVVDDGFPGSPCGRWLPCQHCAEAMNRITVDQVADALRSQLRKAA